MSSRSAWLHIASDHPALAGHFPDHPIVPGAVLLDETLHALEQAASPAEAARSGAPPAGVHWHIASLKFHRLVHPGEKLRLDCSPQPGGALRVELHAAQLLVMSASLEQRAA
jgi:3-hydroxymyristoyl/3-hydroxydecanoyl-(acyl carrier protein) dehydratase